MPIKGQSCTVCYFAEDVVNGGGKAGDAANHTLRVAADGVAGTVAAAPAEVDATNLKGWYRVAVAAGENSGETMILGGISSTSGVVLRGAQWSNVVNLKGWLGTTVPTPNTAGVPKVDVTLVNGVAPSTFDGTAQAGGASTITLASGDSAGTNAYVDRPITIVAGTGAGQSRVISAYNSTTKVATVHRAWDTAPDNTSTYAIDPSAAVADKTGFSIGTGGIAAASFAAGAIDATAIATDAITSAELAASGVSEIAAAVWDLATAGHTTSGTFGAAMNAAGSAGDPWSTSLPGAYGSGTAGNILGNRLDAAVSSRSTYAGADTGGTTTLLSRIPGTVAAQSGDAYARIGAAGAGLTALGDARLANLDATTSSRLATAGYTAPPSDYQQRGTAVTLPANPPAGFLVTASYGTAPGWYAAPVADLRKNTALAGFEFVMTDATAHAPLPGLTVTATRSLDGAAFAACANAPAAIASGVYRIDLAAGDLNANVVTLRFTAAGADDRIVTLITQS